MIVGHNLSHPGEIFYLRCHTKDFFPELFSQHNVAIVSPE